MVDIDNDGVGQSLNISHNSVNNGLYIDIDETLDNFRGGLYINTNNVQDQSQGSLLRLNSTHDSSSHALAYIYDHTQSSVATFVIDASDSSRTGSVLHTTNYGSGASYYTALNTGNGTGLHIDNNGTGKSIYIDHDDTGTNASWELDRDGNNASAITGLKVNVANAGAGDAYAAIFRTGYVGIGDDTPDYKLEVAGSSTNGFFGITKDSNGDIFVVDEHGYVGVGDTSPASLFTVGNGDLFQINSSGNVTMIGDFKLSGSASDVLHDGDLDLYPKDQTTVGLRISTSTENYLRLQGLGTSYININDSLTVTGTLDTTGDVRLGAADTANRQLTISGGATGNVEGGEIQLEMGADYDGTYNAWRMDVYEDDFRIGRTGNTDFSINESGYANFSDRVGIGIANPADKLHIVVSNTNNVRGLQIDQNDTTNDPIGIQLNQTTDGKALEINNSGTGNGIRINQTGTTSNSTSVGGALHINNTSNTGAG